MALAKSLGVAGHIRFLGNQKNVRKYLIASDVYLMTSKYEGIPITTIEALACKTPAILYNVPGLKDFNKDMQCSVLIEPFEKNIPNAIKELMSNQQLRDIITENGYRLVTSKFFLPENVHKVYSLYIN